MATPLPVFEHRRRAPAGPDFSMALNEHGVRTLDRGRVETLQINVGKYCNQACHHCHVEAGPNRKEIMARDVAEKIVTRLARSRTIETVDITGGAPELNPSFRWLVAECRKLGKRVIDRCNLTILGEDGMEWLPDFLASQEVELVCSLPCYGQKNVDQQRGKGVFEKSIRALQHLNRLSYGRKGSSLVLDLVYNPLGPTLPPAQEGLEARYHEELFQHFGIEFHRLLTITNMPIKRFAQDLARRGRSEEYLSLLVNHFNPATIDGLMCRSLVSASWDGQLYDCDFNQMLEIPLCDEARSARSLDSITSFDELEGSAIETASHCFGCTAGTGSSCGGALA